MSSPDGEYDETLALLSMNGLKYQAPESITATSNRVRTQINFNPNAYLVDSVGGVQPSLLFNVGSSFINGMQSMVNVTMTVNTTGGSNAAYFAFGNNTERADGVTSVNSGGSFLNLISDLTVQSKSGELLVRELYKNQNQTQKLYKIDKQRRGVLATMGGAVEVAGGGLKFPIYPVNKGVTFSLPLSELTSMFSSSELLPPQLISGAIMRMTIAPPATALVFYDNTGLLLANSAPAVTLNLKNMSCYLDQYELFDKASSLILSSALSNETSGLKYSYLTQFNTIVNPTGSSFSFDIQLSAAKLQSLVLKFVPKTTWTGIVDVGTGANKFDPTAAATLCDLSTNAGNVGDPNSLGFSLQCRIGSLVMPLFAINSATDMYQQTYNALNGISYSGADDIDPLKVINKLSPCCVSYPEYTRTVDKSALDPRQRNGVGTGCNIFAFTFERSSAVNVSGVSTNNSRILSVQVDNCANAANMQLYASVTYIACANVSNENVVVNK
jgi:hypothetical protein